MLDQPLSGDLRYYFIRAMDALPTFVSEREG
jgi:hypothetical protein